MKWLRYQFKQLLESGALQEAHIGFLRSFANSTFVPFIVATLSV